MFKRKVKTRCVKKNNNNIHFLISFFTKSIRIAVSSSFQEIIIPSSYSDQQGQDHCLYSVLRRLEAERWHFLGEAPKRREYSDRVVKRGAPEKRSRF